MKWIEMFLGFLSKLFVSQSKAQVIESVGQSALLAQNVMSMQGVAEDDVQAVNDDAEEQKKLQEREAMRQAQKQAMQEAIDASLEAERLKQEADIAKSAQEKAESDAKLAQAELEKKNAELQVELEKLKKLQAEASVAEVQSRIAQTQALAGRQKMRRDDFKHNAAAYENAKQEIAEITDEEVVTGVQFSPGGDAVVWIFKRVGTDVIFVGMKIFNPKDFAKRGQ